MSSSRRRCAAAVAATIFAAACERTGPPAAPAAGPRIVSLSPAITRTLVDLGLGGHIAGRSRYCASVDPEVPIAGDLYDVDYETLIRLEPTHLLIQPPSARGAQPRLLELAAERGWSVAMWKIDTIQDVRALIAELPGAVFGADDPRRAEASRRSEALLGDLDASLSPAAPGAWRGTTMLLAGTDPPLAFGKRTYLDDILTALGGANAVDATGWAELSIEDVIRIDPGAIVVVTDRERGPSPLGGLDIRAAREGRIAVLLHPDANLPGSGLRGVAAELRHILESFQ